MEYRWSGQFRCDICNDVCAEIVVSRNLYKNGGESHSLCHKGFTQSINSSISKEDFEKLIRYFRANQLKKIFEMDREFVPFYCPECNKNYCKKHWDHWMEFEGIYYDAEYGYCPKGHRRMLFD